MSFDFTYTQAREVRKLYDTGKYLQKDLADKYNIGRSTICQLIKDNIFKSNIIHPKGNYKQLGKYFIYENGNIWNDNLGRLIRPDIDKDGYSKVYINSKRGIRLSRLLLETFNRLPVANEVARHKDGNKSNNHILNLEWGSYSDNELDKKKHGTANYESHKLSKLEVIEMRRRFSNSKMSVIGFIKKYESEYNLCRTGIANILNFKYWKNI